MAVPSYDDLTPSIPDVEPRERLTALAPWLHVRGPVAVGQHAGAVPVTDQLFAAISGTPRGLDRAASAHPTHALRAASPVEAGRTSARRVQPLSPGEAESLADRRRSLASDRLVAIAREVSPRVERRAEGTVIADVAGLQRLMGSAEAIANELLRAGAPRAAIATTYTAAILLVRTHAGVTVVTGDPAGALQAVPLTVLHEIVLADHSLLSTPRSLRARVRLVPTMGVGGARTRARSARLGGVTEVFEVLRGWGISTLGELAALPADGIAARLGAEGVALQRLARGIDPRPLVPDADVPRVLGTFDLEWPVDTLEPLSFVFARLLEPLSAALARADRGAVALHLDLRLTDRTSHVRRLQLPAPIRDPRVLRTLLLLDLASHPPPAAVDAVTIELDPAPARIVQYSLLERALPSAETLATLMARLGALVGEPRCGSPVLVDSHRPDAFEMGPFAGEARAGGVDPGAFTASDPARLPCTLRRFRPPVAVRVTVEGGRPVRVAIDRQGMPGGAVRQAAGPWRTTGGWWGAARWNRDEWDVALGDGTVCRLFRDRDSGRWFLDAVVD